MSALSELCKKLSDKQYREAFVSAQIKRMLPTQIRALRKQRDWKQGDLAEAAKLTQGAISRAEDPDYGNLTINNLLRIAAGLDVAFVSRFVPFSELGKWYVNLSGEESLMVPSFADDSRFIEHKPVSSHVVPAMQAQYVGNPFDKEVRPTSLTSSPVVGQYRKQPENSPFHKIPSGAAAAGSELHIP
ncbi:MAG: helix-turn-helix domain-containing protein [Terriglobia bacterium]